MSDLVRTGDITTAADLRLVYDIDPLEDVPETIAVCSGEWRKTGNHWTFFADKNWEA